jgi:hypothetical protein
VFSKEELNAIEGLINEEIESYCKDNGFSIKEEYIITLRNILKKLNLKEYWKYDEWK